MVFVGLSLFAMQDPLVTRRLPLSNLDHAVITRMLGVNESTHRAQGGARIVFDPTDNSFILQGTRSQVDDLEGQIIKLDKRPVKFRIQALVQWPDLKRDWSTDSTVYEGSSWTMLDELAGVKIKASPKMASDGSLNFEITAYQGTLGVKLESHEEPNTTTVFDGKSCWNVKGKSLTPSLFGAPDAEAHGCKILSNMGVDIHFAITLSVAQEKNRG